MNKPVELLKLLNLSYEVLNVDNQLNRIVPFKVINCGSSFLLVS